MIQHDSIFRFFCYCYTWFSRTEKKIKKWENWAEQREIFPHVSVYINLEMPTDTSFSIPPNFCQQLFISAHTLINLRVGLVFPLRLPILPPRYQKICFFHQNGNVIELYSVFIHGVLIVVAWKIAEFCDSKWNSKSS